MLMTVGAFCSRVHGDMDALVGDLRDATGRSTDEESAAWRSSLPVVARALSEAELDAFHIHVRNRKSLSLEYRLPAANSWCDLVLLGAGAAAPSAVMLELKDWDTTGDSPGPRAALIQHKGVELLHPSDQVRGYVEYCRSFHSAVLTRSAGVHGCALLTRSKSASSYEMEPHSALVANYPVFTSSAGDLRKRFPTFVRSHLKTADEEWAEEFENGEYAQDRRLIDSVASAVLDPASPRFVLLDGQRRGFELCLQRIDEHLVSGGGGRLVVIVEGPPGSGKSVIAARLWARLSRDPRIEGPKVLVTTSSCQTENWSQAIINAANQTKARGIVKRTSEFAPGVTTTWSTRMKRSGVIVTQENWRENLELLASQGAKPSFRDGSVGLSVVDEAHALIDPEDPRTRGAPSSGWTMHAGPQAYHIIRASRVSIFLTDPNQSYRDNETTTPARIEELARGFEGNVTTQRIELGDTQFRCGGSKEYVTWVESVLSGRAPPQGASPAHWRRRRYETGDAEQGGTFVFEMVPDPLALDECLREHLPHTRSVRLMSSYARRWITRKIDPHGDSNADLDFMIQYERGGRIRHWRRPWNYAPNAEYHRFIQAPHGSKMAEDPLAEVGCPYVVRGFDFDFVGLLWLSDLVWRKDRWWFDVNTVFETAWKGTKARAKEELRAKSPGAACDELVERLRRGYRVLMTRAIRGLYVWVEDDETREYLASALK